MELHCKICDTVEDIRVILRDVKNLEKGFDVYCGACVPEESNEDTNEHGTRGTPRRQMTIEELKSIPGMVNPDISCDFCDKRDPQWLYDLKMEPMKMALDDEEIDFGNRWASCQGCVDLIEAEKMPKISSFDPKMSFMVRIILLDFQKAVHRNVIKGISNKRSYVRSDADGRLKIRSNQTDSRDETGPEGDRASSSGS